MGLTRILSGLFLSVSHEEHPLTVVERAQLSKQPSVAVLLGTAPDGLPLVLQVERRCSVARAVLSALGVDSAQAAGPEVVRALARLEEAVAARARAEGLEELKRETVYRTAATCFDLLGHPLLARLVGADSPLLPSLDRVSPLDDSHQVPITSACNLSPDVAGVMRQLGRRRHLAVPLSSGAPWVVSPRDASNAAKEDAKLEGIRPFVCESLASLPSARFHARDAYERETEGALTDAAAYRQALREASSVAWSVTRADVARSVAQLAQRLEALHAAGKVHADVKPGNTLLGVEGALPIDEVGTEAGRICAAATPGWAAPEQILARPVSPATDVFALGLVLARLAGAVIHGEERTFVIPTGGETRRRMSVLANPDVFIDPTHVELDEPARRAWQALIGACVAFEPETRPRSGAVLAARLSELSARHPLPGRLGLRGGPGRLMWNVDVLGRAQPAWVVSDRRG
ncbi:MAG TPA: hypothetical protein VK447_09085 [Myxococcaceae bacterium]|nr:hypothetical protein [Myxococcaceae bacterium]